MPLVGVAGRGPGAHRRVPRPGRASLRANGPVTDRHREAYEAYADQWEGQSSYGPAMDQVTKTYGQVTAATFTQSWSAAQRSSFARAVQRALQSDAAAQQQGPPRTSYTRRARQHQTPRYTHTRERLAARGVR